MQHRGKIEKVGRGIIGTWASKVKESVITITNSIEVQQAAHGGGIREPPREEHCIVESIKNRFPVEPAGLVQFLKLCLHVLSARFIREKMLMYHILYLHNLWNLLLLCTKKKILTISTFWNGSLGLATRASTIFWGASAWICYRDML